MEVTIYSTPTCHYCDKAKEFFAANGIKYVEHNVKDDLVRREEMVGLSGQRSVPVITVDKQVVTGFDPYAMKVFLGL